MAIAELPERVQAVLVAGVQALPLAGLLGERHELMLDIAGSRPFRAFRRVLTPDATVVVVAAMPDLAARPAGHAAFLVVRG